MDVYPASKEPGQVENIFGASYVCMTSAKMGYQWPGHRLCMPVAYLDNVYAVELQV